MTEPTPLYIEDQDDGKYMITNGETDLHDLTACDISQIKLASEWMGHTEMALILARKRLLAKRKHEAEAEWNRIAAFWDGSDKDFELKAGE